MRNVVIVATAVLTLLAVACTKGEGETSQGSEVAKSGGGDAEKGKQHFAQICATCHGLDAEGIEGLGKGLRSNAFVKSKSDDELAAMIEAGRPADDPLNTTKVAMPPKGGNPGLTDADVRDIVAYVRTLQ